MRRCATCCNWRWRRRAIVLQPPRAGPPHGPWSPATDFGPTLSSPVLPVRPVVITTLFALALPKLKRSVGLCRCAVARSVDHHRPGDARRLIRQSDGGDVEVTASRESGDPRSRHLVAVNPMHGRTGTWISGLRRIGVPSLADPAEPLFATCRILFRDQTYPGCKVATWGEIARIAHCRRQCRGGKRPDGQYRH